MELMKRRLRYGEKLFLSLHHLCYYFSEASYRDDDRQRILEFKNGKESAIRSFIAESINQLLPHQMSKELLIVRALGSDELVADISSEKSLDRLGRALAAAFGCAYVPQTIYKTRTTGPLKLLSLQGRQKMVADAYAVRKNLMDLNYRMILIIDDVVTTGATSCAIIDAILKSFPFAKINVFSLAWTPTISQQAALQAEKHKQFQLGEPKQLYGENYRMTDDDFEQRKTNISLF